MSLILALRAQDGVVLASDGQATSQEGVRTRTQTEKLDLLHGRFAYGCAGDAGLRQRVKASLEGAITEGDCSLPFEKLRNRLHEAVNDVQRFAQHSEIKPNVMHEHEGIGVLLAGFSDGRPWIYEVTRTGGDQEHRIGEQIGAGRHYAAYALASAEHYKLTERGLGQVRLLAYRAIDDAIRTDASTLGAPIQVIQVTSAGARRVSGAELSGVKDAVGAWQGHEREIFELQSGEIELVADQPASAGIEPPVA